jgi:hypothetical protein
VHKPKLSRQNRAPQAIILTDKLSVLRNAGAKSVVQRTFNALKTLRREDFSKIISRLTIGIHCRKLNASISLVRIVASAKNLSLNSGDLILIF